jgi:uncharacterized membrane protein
MKNLFQLFNSDTTHLENDIGMSYYLIQLICELHEWKIEISNSINIGASVKLYIPYTEERIAKEKIKKVINGLANQK